MPAIEFSKHRFVSRLNKSPDQLLISHIDGMATLQDTIEGRFADGGLYGGKNVGLSGDEPESRVSTQPVEPRIEFQPDYHTF